MMVDNSDHVFTQIKFEDDVMVLPDLVKVDLCILIPSNVPLVIDILFRSNLDRLFVYIIIFLYNEILECDSL